MWLQFRQIDVVNLRQSSWLQISWKKCADVAQLAEQLICNQQVIGSSPIIGFSRYKNYIEIWADSRVAKGGRL